MQSQEPQLDLSTQRFHSQSIQKSHSRLRYLWTRVPSIGSLAEVAPSASHATPGTSPVVSATSEPPPPRVKEYHIHFRVQRLMSHFADIDRYRASWLSRWQLYVPIRIRLSPPRPSILPSLGRYSSIWVFYRLLSMLFLSHQSLQIHHRALLSQSRLCLMRSWLQER